MKDTAKKTPDKDSRDLPGVEINEADNDKVTPRLVDERTCTINNNPRTTDNKMP